MKTRDTPPPISLSNRFQNKNSKIVSVDCNGVFQEVGESNAN